MKTFTIRKGLQTIITALAVILLMSSCSQNLRFQSSNIEPEAVGKVRIKKDNNNNYSVKVSVANLTPVKKLIPSKESYVVWAENNNSGVKNLGRIVSFTPLFSKKFKASLSVTTPEKPKRVFITAENSDHATYPDTRIVLTTEYFK